MKIMIIELKLKLDPHLEIIRGFHKVKDSLKIVEKDPQFWADSLKIWNP